MLGVFIISSLLINYSFANVNTPNSLHCISVIRYFLPWCGACRTFDPRWNKFVHNSSKFSSSFVSFYSIDCSTNKEDGHNITKVPTVLMILPNSVKELSTNDIANSFISTILEVSRQPPSIFSSPFVTQKALPNISLQIVYASNSTEDPLAVMLWMYFSSYNFSFTHLLDQNLLSNYRAKKILLFYNNTPVVVLRDSDSFTQYKEAFDKIYKLQNKKMECPSEITQEGSVPKEFTPYDYPPTRDDILTTINHIIFVEVASHGTLRGAKKIVFLKMIDLIYKLVTFDDNLTLCLDGIKAYENQDTIDTDLFSNISACEISLDWVHCKGSNSSYRGYPCGLWVLFHYLTVQQHRLSVNHNFVLLSIADYITNFFSCRNCSTHFENFISNMRNVNSYESAVLYLHQAHNTVNARISGSPTEDPYHKKIQFPSHSQCPQCYSGEKAVGSEILKFLKEFYSFSAKPETSTRKMSSVIVDNGISPDLPVPI